MEPEKEAKLSILMFPWLAHGHLYPYLELAKILTKRNFHIYFCSTPISLTAIFKDDILANTSIQPVELHLPSLPDLPPQYHTSNALPHPYLKLKLFQALQMSSSNFSDIVTSLKPHLLIYDVFQPWAARIAASLSIPAVHFTVLGAAAYSFYRHWVHHGDSPSYPYEGIYLKEHEIKFFQNIDYSALSLTDETNDKESFFSHFKLSCEVVLMTTCRAIEGKYIDYLSILTGKKILPVGPLVKQIKHDENNYILKWLSGKKQFSTVLIAFGSENSLSKDQMEEMAKGLEACDDSVNFIWVVRSAFPVEGFTDRVKGRGIIVEGWAPQAQILAHKSVGAFVSHCGMSSTIESFYFGVPVIALPFGLDQPFDARLLVASGVAVEVERDGDGLFTGKDFADAVNKAVVEKTAGEMRIRAAKFREKMRIDHEKGDAVDEAVEELRRLCVDYKQKK